MQLCSHDQRSDRASTPAAYQRYYDLCAHRAYRQSPTARLFTTPQPDGTPLHSTAYGSRPRVSCLCSAARRRNRRRSRAVRRFSSGCMLPSCGRVTDGAAPETGRCRSATLRGDVRPCCRRRSRRGQRGTPTRGAPPASVTTPAANEGCGEATRPCAGEARRPAGKQDRRHEPRAAAGAGPFTGRPGRRTRECRQRRPLSRA